MKANRLVSSEPRGGGIDSLSAIVTNSSVDARAKLKAGLEIRREPSTVLEIDFVSTTTPQTRL